MGQVLSYAVGNIINLELSVKQDGVGVTGLSARVALRDAVSNKYLDWADNTFKSSGWIQKYQSLTEFGRGIYQYIWNSFDAIKGAKAVIAEYEVTSPGEEAQAEDILVFGLTEAIESGRWKIANNQMIFYAPDGVTPLLIFNLYDGYGIPSEVNVKERVKV